MVLIWQVLWLEKLGRMLSNYINEIKNGLSNISILLTTRKQIDKPEY